MGSEKVLSYRVLFTGYDEPGEDDWIGNAYRFGSRYEAECYGSDRASQWAKIKGWRVVASADAVNSGWDAARSTVEEIHRT